MNTQENNQPSTIKEGETETGRELLQYADALFFEPELLNGHNLLNLGSGSSNLGDELSALGFKTQVANVDITYDPFIAHHNKPFRSLFAQAIQKYSQRPQEKKRSIIRSLMGTSSREIVQADMRILPYKNDSFDFVFALASTYQMPARDRIIAFDEMMRLGKFIHISPIFESDFNAIVELISSGKYNFEIVICYPPPSNMLDESPVRFQSTDDYTNYSNSVDLDKRVYIPTATNYSIKSKFWFTGIKKLITFKGAYTIILRRMDPSEKKIKYYVEK